MNTWGEQTKLLGCRIPNTVGRSPALPQRGGARPPTPDVGAAFFPRAQMRRGERESNFAVQTPDKRRLSQDTKVNVTQTVGTLETMG